MLFSAFLQRGQPLPRVHMGKQLLSRSPENVSPRKAQRSTEQHTTAACQQPTAVYREDTIEISLLVLPFLSPLTFLSLFLTLFLIPTTAMSPSFSLLLILDSLPSLYLIPVQYRIQFLRYYQCVPSAETLRALVVRGQFPLKETECPSLVQQSEAALSLAGRRQDIISFYGKTEQSYSILAVN